MKFSKALTAAALAICALPAFALDIVKDGKSPFSIYVPADCPAASVKWAAQELQKYCQAVTGAMLPIVDKPASPMISLGFNDAAKAAGYSIDNLMPEAYEFRVKNGNLYVFGEDTPDGMRSKQGGVCHATRNGVCTILEEFFGVRWLMPGPNGDYVPHKATVTIPDEGRLDKPAFFNRRLPCIQAETYQIVRDWSAHQKLGLSLYLEHSHNWFKACPPEMFKEHPEWYAKSNGESVPPTGELFFLCLSNRSTIERYAQAACEFFEKHPSVTCYSLSPNDSSNWCDCPECTKLYGEKDIDGKPSYTTYILTFYNEVTKLVRKRYPNRILAGYIYQDYICPPEKAIKLEDGLFLVWAVSFDYGYQLFRDSVRYKFATLLTQWTQSTENIAYYDLPTYTNNPLSIPCTPGLEILKFIFPRIKNSNMKGIYYYGNRAWGTAAVHNYIAARLEWNPYADVDAIFKEFCDLAYAEASPEMQAIYHLYDSAVKDYYIKNSSESFTISDGRMRTAYAGTLPQVAELFSRGLAKVTDAKVKARMNYFKVNLQLMEWNLKQICILPADFKSCFTSTAVDINAILQNKNLGFAIQISKKTLPKFAPFAKSAVGASIKAAKPREALVRGKQTIAFVPKADGTVVFKFHYDRQPAAQRRIFFYDANGKLLHDEIVTIMADPAFKAKKGELYYAHYTPGTDIYSVNVENAYWGFHAASQPEGIHLQNRDCTLFFNVPKGTKSFEAWCRCGDSIRETCLGAMTTPSGRVIQFDCSRKFCDKKTIDISDNEAGIWKITISKSPVMHFDDHFFKILNGIPPVVSQDPANLIICK